MDNSKLYLEAVKNYNEKKYGEAAVKLELVLNEEPEHCFAKMYQALCVARSSGVDRPENLHIRPAVAELLQTAKKLHEASGDGDEYGDYCRISLSEITNVSMDLSVAFMTRSVAQMMNLSAELQKQTSYGGNLYQMKSLTDAVRGGIGASADICEIGKEILGTYMSVLARGLYELVSDFDKYCDIIAFLEPFHSCLSFAGTCIENKNSKPYAEYQKVKTMVSDKLEAEKRRKEEELERQKKERIEKYWSERRDEYNRLTSRKEELEKECGELQEEISTKKRKLSKLNSEMSVPERNPEVASLRERQNSLRAELESIGLFNVKRKKELRQEIENLSPEISAALKEERRMSDEKISKLKEQVSVLKNEVSQAQQKLEDIKKEKNDIVNILEQDRPE